ncbi:MAG TPA: DUF494 family protein [Candidatus Wallbacteria bacterium]|nr:MAG: hypothetical protein BWY32_01444 [bacterium ADurb.Bin243]HOD39966.1 DUF494 family protein [Candidatus Wallbacteria bacterium]HPG58725.1 DUF494 family protein [Candidatus Wallbacteria bacterium]
MNKLVQIFLKFLKLMKENGSDFKKSRTELIKEGFLLSEIDAALEWYFGESHVLSQPASGAKPIKEPSDKSFRFFTMAEERLLSFEARGYLTELLAGKAISHEEIESVLETLSAYLVEDASIEEINNIMIGFRTVDISAREGAEDAIEFKVRYIQ